MAIRSAYIINEEQDGFVAVDFDFINAHHDDEDRLDLTAWEFVDADVDDCSDDVSESDASAGSDAETIVGEDDDCSSICGMSDDVSESVESDVSSEYCAETVVGEDVESLPELSISPEYFDGEDKYFVSETIGLSDKIAGGDAELVPEKFISPEYSEETIAGEDANSSMLPEYKTERISGYSDSVTTTYCYEEEEDLEEDNYDLDDELIPYNVNGKLGRDRMRKLGKRSCAKSVKSKRLTYNYNKAGCFRGKHGLGLKHSLI